MLTVLRMTSAAMPATDSGSRLRLADELEPLPSEADGSSSSPVVARAGPHDAADGAGHERRGQHGRGGSQPAALALGRGSGSADAVGRRPPRLLAGREARGVVGELPRVLRRGGRGEVPPSGEDR
jgi:hypothetical protein